MCVRLKWYHLETGSHLITKEKMEKKRTKKGKPSCFPKNKMNPRASLVSVAIGIWNCPSFSLAVPQSWSDWGPPQGPPYSRNTVAYVVNRTQQQASDYCEWASCQCVWHLLGLFTPPRTLE